MYPDPRMLIDSVTLQKQRKDRYGKYQPVGDPILLARVRVDRTKQYAYQGDTRTLVANLTVFIYPRFVPYAPKLDDSWLGAILAVDGQNYTVTNVNQFSEPYRQAVYSYEVEAK
ncbi:MAG: putative minor capsid protein [Schleiferilactobacillus perolens]|uniref:putative minor capsid protein n=1 Tax=Schleiferilactobacillus perolens TaxID=100468 RepID=UPI0039ED192D